MGESTSHATIVREFALSQERIRLRIGRGRPSVVLLLPVMEQSYLRRVERALKGLKGRIRVVYRVGSPLVVDDLQRMAIDKANTVVLVATGETKEARALADTRTVQSFLTLDALEKRSKNKAHFDGVVELTFALNASLIETAALTEQMEISATDGFVSRVIALALRRPGVLAVFEELFTQGQGHQVYLVPVPASWGSNVRFASVDSRLAHALPMGVKIPRDRGVQGDAQSVSLNTTEIDGQSKERGTLSKVPFQELRILILHWNARVTAILRELDATRANERFRVTIVCNRPVQEIRTAIDRYAPNLNRVKVELHEADPTFPHELNKVDLTSFTRVLFVASDRFDDTQSADAQTLMSFLRLKQLLSQRSTGKQGALVTESSAGPRRVEQAVGVLRPTFMVEVLEPLNAGLYGTGDQVQVLFSQNMISHLLAQIALRPDLNGVYHQLSSAYPARIDFVPVTQLLAKEGQHTFQSVFERAAEIRMIAIGLRIGGEVNLNPSRHAAVRHDDNIDVIVLV